MELVKQFNSELSSLYEARPPISKAKMTSITRTAIKAIKLYKHVVQSVEKFIQKCKPEYKVPGLYVIDSIVRQSRHQFGTERDVFAPRFARNLQQTFVQLFNCPPEDKSKVIRVLNLWQKNNVFDSEVIQPLFDLADPNHPVHKEQAALAPSNGITPVKPPAANNTPKNASTKKEGGTAGWINQLNTDSHSSTVQQKPHAPNQAVDVSLIQQLQQLQTLLLDQQADNKKTSDSDQIKFDKKLLDFDYGEEEDEDGPPQHHQQQQQVVAGLDSLGSILSNPEVLRQLQTLQQTLSNPQALRQQQQLEMEEKMRKMQEMRQQEEEFDKHLAQTVPNLPFADQCELKPGELSGFPGMDLSQPPPGYPSQQKLMVPPGMMMKPPPSPLEDGEHASSDADERIGGPGEEGGPSVVVLDSDSPSDSPAQGRRRRRRSRSRSRSHHRRSRSDSRSRSRNKRKRRSSSFDDKDWERIKQREAEKEKERERKRKGLPPLKKNHLAVCSTTLWIGHLSKLVQQEELSDTFGEYGDIVSIDLIPPRGCAFICMNRRQDAHRALQGLAHHKLQGKTITLAWAPGKGMKGKEYKDYWEVEQGVSYIPWSKLTHDIDLELLEEGGMIDEESMPDWLKERQKKNKDDDQLRSQSSSQAEDDESLKGGELDIPVPAPTIPGYIPLPDGPQPSDRPPVSQPPPTMPPLMGPGPPLGMMPPFAVPREYTGLLGPMGMAMGPGLMPNVPLGVPPPGMQGLMGNPLMHQQMMSRMPQPVGSPFNPPPGVGLLGPQLSQIPLPGQDKSKAGLAPLGVPPPNDGPTMPPFTEAMMQLPFTLPPQLQLPGMGMLTRPPVADNKSGEDNDKRDNSSPPTSGAGPIQSPFGQPPPQFSPMSLMKIPPPMSIPPSNKGDGHAGSEDKDERELKDKDYRDTPKDYKDRDKDRDRDRDYRNKRDRDYRGDRDYRDRFDKDYRERDKDYRDKDRDRKDRRERSRDGDEKSDQDLREKDGKPDDKERKDESSKDDKGYRDRNDRDRSRNRDRERDRDRGRERKWGDRDRERGRDRDREDRRGRDRERERSKEMKGGSERDKSGPNIQERLRNMAHEQDRGEFPRGGMEPDNFQGPPGGPNFGPRSEGFHPEGYPPDMHGRHPGGRREGFDNRGPGPRDMFDHRGPPPDGFDPRGPPPEGFGPRGGPPMDNFGPRGPPPDGFGPRGPPPDGFGPRGPPPDGFGPRGPPPDGFGPRGPPPDGFDLRGPPPGSFGPDGFDPRGPPPEFDGQGPPSENFNMRGPPPGNFNRGPLIPDNFGPGGPPPDNFLRGPPSEEFGPLGPPFEGFGTHMEPPGEFQPRIRFELFSRGRGRGQDFRGRGGRGGGPAMFSPRGAGPRGPRAGPWMESQGPSPPKPGFGFPPRGFAPPESGPERFGPPVFEGHPVFEDSSRGRGGQGIRGRGRGFQGHPEERRWEGEGGTSPSPKRLSRWSNPSPPPSFMPPGEESRVESDSVVDASAIESVPMDVSESDQDPVSISDADKNPDNPFVPEDTMSRRDRSVSDVLLDINQGSESSVGITQLSTEVTADDQPVSHNLAAEERNFPFGGVNEDSSNMQIIKNLITEPEASSVFHQDSQSMADVEMSNSNLSSAESGQQSQPEDFKAFEASERRESSQPPDKEEEYQPSVNPDGRGSFADIGFPERISHPEDKINSSLQEERQASMTEIEESFQSHASRRLSDEMHQNIEFSMGDSVSSMVEQSVFETHSTTGPEYDPNQSSQSIHFEQKPSDVFSENSQPCSQQTFSVEEPQQNFPSFQEQRREDELNFSEDHEPVQEPLPAEASFDSQHDEMVGSEMSASEISAPEIPVPLQSCESGEVRGEILSGEMSSQEHNSSVEDSQQ